MKLPPNVSEYVSPFTVEGHCRECPWIATGRESRSAAIEHTAERGHDTFLSVIGHTLYTKTPAAEVVTP